CARSGSLFDYW
nr:immunoglobulin heavy chain junction region [Mus musculus]MBK4196277.1 immunoglobulin heavy chain junction region [Mus musculus]MBK4196278.1 immunoglobulin heavy chain junction region [Mus musculus]